MMPTTGTSATTRHTPTPAPFRSLGTWIVTQLTVIWCAGHATNPPICKWRIHSSKSAHVHTPGNTPHPHHNCPPSPSRVRGGVGKKNPGNGIQLFLRSQPPEGGGGTQIFSLHI